MVSIGEEYNARTGRAAAVLLLTLSVHDGEEAAGVLLPSLLAMVPGQCPASPQESNRLLDGSAFSASLIEF
jgi:hypothetical protein